MKEEIFDKRIKELAESAQVTPSPESWDRIRKGLDRSRRVVLWKKITVSVAAAAAALVAGLIHWPETGEESIVPTGTVAEVREAAPAPEAIEATEVPEISKPITVLPSEKKDLLAVVYEEESKDIQQVISQSEEVETMAEVETPEAVRPQTETIAEETETEADDDYYEWVTESTSYKETKKKSHLSFSANGLMSPTDASGNVDFSSQSFTSGAGGVASGRGIVPISVPEHSFPVTVGIDAKYSFLNDRLGLGIGVNYTFMKSSYEAIMDQSSQGNVQQRLHYIGIPLNFYVNFINAKRFALYANVGGMMEKGVSAVYNITDLSGNPYTIEDKIDGVQWSVNVGIGLEYRFVEFAGLYLDPHLTYFFDCDQPYSVRTEQPLQFGLQLGFRFHI